MNCAREEVTQDPHSPGPVRNVERIARGAYSPNHGNPRTGNIKPSVIPRNDLLEDRLSVWRLEHEGVGVSPADLINILNANPEENKTLFMLLWATAKSIREIKYSEQNLAALCVLDECDTDFEGGKHSAHAHIALTTTLKALTEASPDAEDFVQVWRDLSLLMRSDKARQIAVDAAGTA